MKIEVFGTGCPKCNRTKEYVDKTLKELNINAEVVQVTDIKKMIDKGIIGTPALAINDKIVIQGKIPTVEQIKEFIKKEGN